MAGVPIWKTKKPLASLAPSRFNIFYRPFALLTQDAKHAKKDIVTAGCRRSQLACIRYADGKQPKRVGPPQAELFVRIETSAICSGCRTRFVQNLRALSVFAVQA